MRPSSRAPWPTSPSTCSAGAPCSGPQGEKAGLLWAGQSVPSSRALFCVVAARSIDMLSGSRGGESEAVADSSVRPALPYICFLFFFCFFSFQPRVGTYYVKAMILLACTRFYPPFSLYVPFYFVGLKVCRRKPCNYLASTPGVLCCVCYFTSPAKHRPEKSLAAGADVAAFVFRAVTCSSRFVSDLNSAGQ